MKEPSVVPSPSPGNGPPRWFHPRASPSFRVVRDIAPRRLAAVWFADLVDYTTLAEKDEDAALELVEDLQSAARHLVEGHGGRVVKFVGDAVLAEFPSVGETLRSALALPIDLRQRREHRGRGPRPLRLGVHVGEVAATPDGDLLGEGVNLASRLQTAASADQVLCSEDVVRHLRRRSERGFEEGNWYLTAMARTWIRCVTTRATRTF